MGGAACDPLTRRQQTLLGPHFRTRDRTTITRDRRFSIRELSPRVPIGGHPGPGRPSIVAGARDAHSLRYKSSSKPDQVNS